MVPKTGIYFKVTEKLQNDGYMTSYVKDGTRNEKDNFQNVSMIILNNSDHYKHHLKIKLKCLKRDQVDKLLKNGKMTTTNDVKNET